MSGANPVLVEVVRGSLVESRHRGAVAVCDVRSRVVHRRGDVKAAVYPRSAVKPIQTLPLIESGAAERFAVNDGEIALSAASHNGESLHTEIVGRWLTRLGLSMGDLACGAHVPMDGDSAEALVRVGQKPSPLHNTCSGKHVGMLTTALHRGAGAVGYLSPSHPVQVEILAALAEMGGFAPKVPVVGTDGCGVPTLAMPLTALATAFARMADPESLSPARAAAARRVVCATLAHPYMVAGRDRFDTLATVAGGGAFMVKGGAEGVHAALIPERGLGVALKIDDGTKRAAEVAMVAVLWHLDVLDDGARAQLAPYLDQPLLNVAGVRVGSIRPASDWLTRDVANMSLTA